MIRVPLSEGLFAVVDDEDSWTADYVWHPARRGKMVYAARHVRRPDGSWTKEYLHRAIAHAAPGVRVDHRDRDGLNCRRGNLRLASHAQNEQNRGSNRNNTSGFKGVTWYRRHRRWKAQIDANGIHRHLGYFERAEDAARAYDAAARELHGLFACLNFPEAV